ncbi:MAG: AMP-binding protein [Alphaproteobacteria bacterium]|nr:AMP-binding protein [Alphaproteobacteria bacterium]MDG2457959.1 AMP-binding protein [Alphaproteobacteria bacterium]
MTNYPDIKIHNTLPKILRHRSISMPDTVALRDKDLGIWNEITWKQYNNNVSYLALALSKRGFKTGDVIGLIGDNKPSWLYFELAAQAVGGMSLGIYRDTLDEEVGYLINAAKVNFVYAEDQEQVDKILTIKRPKNSQITMFYEDSRGLKELNDPHIVDMLELMNEGQAIANKTPNKYNQMIDKVSDKQEAILCTTSGTTSNPKLAMLPGGKFVEHVLRYLNVDPKTVTDEYVSVLPFPWIMEQIYGVGFNIIGGMKVNFPERPETAMEDLREVGPTFMLGAPRLWEQIAADMRSRILDAPKITQWLFNVMVERGLKAVDQGKRDFLADKLLFSALKDRLGFSKVTSAATGGSAIGPETFKFFLAMGIPLRQLYGQTELMGAYTLQDVPQGTMDCETVGVPFPDCEVKIIDPDPNGLGEIITKHPSMFSGYFNNQKAYKDTIKKGWMQTGDAGFFDEKGRLNVLDRVNDIAVKSDGVKFSPQNIENKLKFSPYVGEAVVIGSDKPYLTAIICIRFSIVSKLAEKWQLAFTSYTGLAADKKIYSLIEEEISKVNSQLPDNTKIAKFLLLFKELEADDGELTRTRKVRRSVINSRYKDIIKDLYLDKDKASINTEFTLEDGRKSKISATMEIRHLIKIKDIKAKKSPSKVKKPSRGKK